MFFLGAILGAMFGIAFGRHAAKSAGVDKAT